MQSLASFLLFGLALGSLLMVLAGVRLLNADNRLRARIDGASGAATGLTGKLPFPLPRMFTVRGRDRSEIEQKLRKAGYFEANALETFAWLRLAAAGGVALASMATCFVINGNPLRPLFPTLALAGLTYIGAKYVLQMRAATRERILTAEFPFLLDLMLMMLESGVSLDQCFRGIAREERVAVPNHARLVAMLVEDLDRGQDYQLAFDRWASRVAVNGARELATVFRQSLFHGMELVPSLREFIREFSQRRVARAREAIGSITVRMVILMLVFFMPALFIVLAGPPVAAILDTLGGLPHDDPTHLQVSRRDRRPDGARRGRLARAFADRACEGGGGARSRSGRINPVALPRAYPAGPQGWPAARRPRIPRRFRSPVSRRPRSAHPAGQLPP
ncbi:type II secretion system F family protein [Novosphingobium lindaniclasticum]